MTKIRNRFTKKAILTVHDNLLADLYKLYGTGWCKEIDGEEYLINEAAGRGYKVGLRVKIPLNLLEFNGVRMKCDELPIWVQEEIVEKLKDKLYFSNVEILLTNILLDKFLQNNREFDISLKEIEAYYRKKVSSYRNVKINDLTYNRYIKTINSLIEKEVYLKTTSSFRNYRYGVNNRDFVQPFLSISNQYYSEENNVTFCYSFGQFGNVLKLSRRYDDNLSPGFYMINFNQAMKHTIAYYIGQQIFIWSRDMNNRDIFKDYFGPIGLNINLLLQSIHYETRDNKCSGCSIAAKLDGYKSQPNKNRTYRMVIKYIAEVLEGFRANKSIYDFELSYSYDETEDFVQEHEFDYDDDDNLQYDFSIKDINQNVSVSIDIFLTDLD